jgi:glycosyltransferase involved in cell wall biosynthesis
MKGLANKNMEDYHEMPLISVIIPVYNCEKWVKDSIQSVINQIYKNFEIIIINDGSTDNTSKVLEGYKGDNRISVYEIQNTGPSRARNLGVSKAKGDYIAFLDADDLWDEYKLEKQIEYFRLHPDCNLLITNVKQITHNEEIIKLQYKSLPREKEEQLICFFQGKITMNTPTILMNKSVFHEIGGFKSELVHREDHFFLMQVANKYRIHLLREHLVYRRVWEGSISSDFKKIDNSNEEIIEFFKKTRYPFYETSIEYFPFLSRYLGVELSKYYNMLSMRLFRLGFIQSSRKQLLKAIKSNFSFIYIVKLLGLYLPSSVRQSIIILIDKIRKIKG